MATLVKKIISTARAPAAMGPYSQAVLVDRTMYIAGQLGMDPLSGQLVPGGAKEQTYQEPLGVLQTLAQGRIPALFHTVSVYQIVFPSGLPYGWQSSIWKRLQLLLCFITRTSNESDASLMMLSSLDNETSAREQPSLESTKALQNIGEILKAAGCDSSNVVKTTVLMTDMMDFNDINEVYKQFFKCNFPARAAYQVVALPKGACVEIEAIAISGPLQDASPAKI